MALKEILGQLRPEPEREPVPPRRHYELSSRGTYRHYLLTMSAGFGWNELRLPPNPKKKSDALMAAAPDPYRYLLSQPLEEKPDESLSGTAPKRSG